MSYVNADNFANIAQAISLYADAARVDHALLLSTGVVGSDARVSDSGEGFTGVLRWLEYFDGDDLAVKPSTTNTLAASLADDEYMRIDNLREVYVKNIDATAARENSIQSLISRVDGLSYLGRQFGASRARKEDANLRNVIKGVVARIYQGAGATAPTDLSADTDAGVINLFGYRTAYTDSSTSFAPLFQNDMAGSPLGARSAFFDQLLNAMAAVAQEFEQPYYYLAVNADTYNVLRKQNVMDAAPVQDGNITFSTILGGKIRLLVTGNAGTISPDNSGTDKVLNTNLMASVLISPAALHYSNIAVNNPTAIDTNVVTNKGFGDVAIVSRWGNIIHPRGYTSTATGFPTNSSLGAASGWTTVAKNVNQTGIFPIFHGPTPTA